MKVQIEVHGRKSKSSNMNGNQPCDFYASPSFVSNALNRDATGIVTYTSIPFCMNDPFR